jgi:hypothetical protein
MPKIRHNKLTKILILFFCLSFSSCVFLSEGRLKDFANQNSFLNRFPENQKSIIIVKVNGRFGSAMWWCSQRNILKYNSDNCFKLRANKQYQILMIEPGLYYFLKSFRKYPPIFSPVQKDYDKIKRLSTFTAKAGEIVYIGDLSIRRSSWEDDGFRVRDGFKKLDLLLSNKNPEKTKQLFASQMWERKYLIKNYPNLKTRLTKRLVKGFDLEKQKKSRQKKRIKNSSEKKIITINL